MVKHIHVTLSNDKHQNLSDAKQDYTWEEIIEKGINSLER